MGVVCVASVLPQKGELLLCRSKRWDDLQATIDAIEMPDSLVL